MSVKAYKGFNKDMTCRGFQFEEGKTYHEDKAKLCESGFHACKNPLDCFKYYNPAQSIYHEVELDEVSGEGSWEDSKACGKTIKIGAKLELANICKLHFEYVKANTTNEEIGENSSSLAARNSSSLAAQDNCKLKAGINSVLAAFNSKTKAGMNSLIALANRKWNGREWVITDFAAAIVDGKTIKPDTWYTLKGGKFVEAAEEDEKNEQD